MRLRALTAAMAAAFPLLPVTVFATETTENATQAERVIINGDRPSSLPKEIPTTIEGISAKTMEQTINAIDAEDALKYLPSLLVRKRYVGDYNHAVLATRASGTGNSARSMVYADGILLSNLLGNGASFTPRWGLVTPEEIERVDVLYGPFSAAYAGNSAGAVVDYVTRMPRQFEAHAKLVGFSENFQQYGTDKSYSGKQLSASLGNKQGAFSWWLNVNQLDSDGHPIAFANKLASTGISSNAGTAVTGAIA
ncbi:MAG: TonB-dependent receptor plug domain-containing protein, partial [Pseudomonadota bacterium]